MQPERRLSLVDIHAMGGVMRRDEELLRKLMLEIEADPEPVVIYDNTRDMDDEDRRVYYHLRLLADARFLEESGKFGGAFRITNDGHDFIGMMKDDGLWSSMKSKAGAALPRYGLRLLFEVGNGLLRQKLRDMGIPLE
ncbi:DUF2513 domain-containing protein [Sulfitobacter faviae]|uniref:DUF2513 domain-containing protein n=1 Tax=Sulfitobacter faviae TaxID=1775881 RepID=UPI0024567BA8|nr:DUF2513 domain-containing protein [Sulfitobacter faviae]